MEMVGGGTMHVYSQTDEGPHTPGPEANWQESVVLIWWDPKQSVGGYLRIGHEPNHDDGKAILWNAVFTPEHVFHRTSEMPLTAADKIEHGFGAGNGALRFHYDSQCVWTAHEPELDLTLHLEDFHPAIDGYRKDGVSQLGLVGAQHVEVACRVTGELTAKGKTYTIDGLGMRDHGWGARDWNSIWAHRWAVGVFDRDNSFCALAMHTARDTIVKFGWVVRGDKVIYAHKTDIVAYLACDAATNVGGKILMTLSTGEKFQVSFAPVAPAVMFNHENVACVDTLSRISWGDKDGVGVFETSSNLQAGSRHPQVLDGGIATDGWHSNPVTSSVT
jgi:hypothetical protein